MFVASRHHSRLLMLLLIFVSCFASACGLQNDSITTPSDTSAANLEVELSIGPSQLPNMLVVDVYFRYHKTFVRFQKDEHIICNNVTLRFTTNTFSAYIPDPPANQNITCIYSDARGATTMVAFPTLTAPVVLTPRQGATVVRSKDFAVTYVPQTSKQILVNAGTYIADNKQTGTSCVSEQVTGTVVCDVTTLPSGKGTLSVDLQTNTSLANSGFRSATVTTDVVTNLNVTWL